MPNCRYCGKNAGLFSLYHKECKEKWEKGCAELLAEIHAYFKGQVTMNEVQKKVSVLRHSNFIKNEDVIKQSETAIRLYADSLQVPITPQHLQLIDIYIKGIGIRKDSLNANGCLNYLGKKLYSSVLASFYNEGVPSDKIERRLKHVEALLPVTDADKKEAGIDRMAQSVILHQVQQGTVPQSFPLSFPVLLGRNEAALWCYDNVTMFQEKIEKEYVGGHNGFSIRVMKGVRYNTGKMKGKAVEHSTMANCGTGTLVITNKHIMFCSNQQSLKLPYTKIIGLTPYSDGIEVHRDGKTNRLVFQGLDSWFISNLLPLINS